MRTAVLLLLLLAAGCGGTPSYFKAGDRPAGTGFLLKQTDGPEPRRYALFVPRDYAPRRAWPVVVFLHGLGEAGSTGAKATTVGLGPELRRREENGEAVPFLVAFPTSGGDWTGRAEHVAAVLDDVQENYRTDPRRVTVTGLSTGGQGAWQVAGRYPGRFARVVPMCAWDAAAAVPGLVGTPVWAFHNAGDFIIPVGETRRMVRLLRDAGGDVRYTEYGSVSHDCWRRAYRDPALWAWMAGGNDQ